MTKSSKPVQVKLRKRSAPRVTAPKDTKDAGKATHKQLFEQLLDDAVLGPPKKR